MRVLIFLCVVVGASAQSPDVWKVLAQVDFESKPAENSTLQMDSPKFSAYLWSWNGKKVSLAGYLIPMAELGGRDEYMLSSLPFNQCYFCGGAGPETVVEVQTREKISFTTRQISLEGILFLNDFDPDHHMYIIKDAKLVER
jgi:hypothetical protein